MAQQAQVSEEQARAVAEESRESGWDKPSLAKELFLGRFPLFRVVFLQISLLLPGSFLKLLLLFLSRLFCLLCGLVSVWNGTLGLRCNGHRPCHMQDRQQRENGNALHPESFIACARNVQVRQTT